MHRVKEPEQSSKWQSPQQVAKRLTLHRFWESQWPATTLTGSRNAGHLVVQHAWRRAFETPAPDWTYVHGHDMLTVRGIEDMLLEHCSEYKFALHVQAQGPAALDDFNAKLQRDFTAAAVLLLKETPSIVMTLRIQAGQYEVLIVH